MPVAFASPQYLLLLLVLWPLVWLLGRRSLSGLDTVRRRLALGLRLTVVLLLVLALAEVEWRDQTDRVEVIFALDYSRSVPDEQLEQAKQAINKAQAAMDPRRDLGKVVVFGADASTETKLQRDRPPFEKVSSLVDRNHSNLEAAVRRGLEALEPDVRGRIVIVSDGNQTMGDASAAIAAARAKHVAVDVLPLEYAYDQEVLVEKIVLPADAKTGEPFTARVVTHAVSETPAVIKLSLNGGVIESREVVLKPGPNVEEFQLNLKEADFYRVRATVEPKGRQHDHLIQNNTANGFVFARGKQQILYVHDPSELDGQEDRFFTEALISAQMRIKAITPGDFPLEPIELQNYDAIILDDVERSSFSERQQRAIESAVGDMGVGLLMIGGERGFGAGDWRGSPVEAALPVEMDIKQEEVIPDGALVMIIHSCEMAQGNAMAIKVCKQAVDGLSSKDTVGVLIFGPQGNEWVIKPQRARNKIALKNRIHNMVPSDMPDFDGIFRMALDALGKVNASVRHMILMSDGDPSPPAPSLLRKCQAKKITVSTICYASHEGAQGPNAQTMRRIANMTGGKYYYLEPNDSQKLPRIFTKEAQSITRSLIVNQTFVPQQRTNSTVLNGLSSFPPLTGYVLTEAKPRAEVPLVSPDGSPVLAHWFYGVGKSAAFTSDAKPRWAASWIEWAGFQSFWAQTVRWISKDVQESYYSVQTRVRGDKGVVVLDAVTPDGQLVDGLSVRARITPPDEKGKEREVDLVQKGAGRYEAEFPIDEVGTYNVHLLTTEDGQVRHSLTTGLVFPYSEEFKRLRSNRAALEELARQGDGQTYTMDAALAGDVNFWDRESLGEKIALEQRWTWALALALFLFLLDVAVRRVAIDYDKLWARAKAVVTRQPKPEGRTMDRLRERKAEVQASRVPLSPPPIRLAGEQKKFEAQAPTGQEAEVAGATPGRPAPPPKTKPQAEKEPPQQEGSTYSRLLEAKRRARQDLDQDENKDKKKP